MFLSLSNGETQKTKKVDGLDRRSEGARLFITAGIENHLESPTTAMNPVGWTISRKGGGGDPSVLGVGLAQSFHKSARAPVRVVFWYAHKHKNPLEAEGRKRAGVLLFVGKEKRGWRRNKGIRKKAIIFRYPFFSFFFFGPTCPARVELPPQPAQHGPSFFFFQLDETQILRKQIVSCVFLCEKKKQKTILLLLVRGLPRSRDDGSSGCSGS